MPGIDPSSLVEMDEAFYQSVYAQVARIPSGRVTTYGKIAELAGYVNASREVGIAMSLAPSHLHLPCHRVVNKAGTLAPDHAFGGQARQREMLLSEGVAFLPNGCIHMERHMWPDDPQGEQMSLF